MGRRAIESELHNELIIDQFSFLPDGPVKIDQIYSLVQGLYPLLCDDNFKCSDCCSSGGDQPEWKHVVRSVLNILKNKGLVNRVASKTWVKVQR